MFRFAQKPRRQVLPCLDRLEDRLAPSADLSLTTSVSNPHPLQDGVVTYTVTATNGGPNQATGVAIRGDVPDAFGTPTSISHGGTVVAGNDVEWTGLTVPAGQSLVLTYSVSVGSNETFVAPSTSLGGHSWNRPTTTPYATFQAWDVFSSATGGNAPHAVTGPNFGGGSGDSWKPVNVRGGADAFDRNAASSGSIITSSANIYSPTGVVMPRVVVPNNIDGNAGDSAAGWTTLVLQVRTQGSELDPSSVVLRRTDLGGPTESADASVRLSNSPIPGFGVGQGWAFVFKVAGNADVYTFDFSALGTSLSLDRIAVDTIWNPSAASEIEAHDLPLPAADSSPTFLAPSTSMGAQAWNRPKVDSHATYQGWETFSSSTGPNSPQHLPGPAFGSPSGTVWAPVNPGTAMNAFDSNQAASGSFIASSGNIYTPTGTVMPRVVVPNNMDGVVGDNPNGWTTLLLQIRTAGATLDRGSLLLNGTATPIRETLLARSTIPGFGDRETWAFLFQVEGNADSYTFDVSASGSSLSLDRVAVDTIWHPTATSSAEAYDLAFPFEFATDVWVTAAEQSDPDSTPTNGPSVDEDDDARATVAVGFIEPTVEGIAPFVGPTTGFTVTITGTGFTGATGVDFGGKLVAIPSNPSYTTIVVSAPASATFGDVDVVVIGPAGSSIPTAATPGVDQITYAPTKLTGVVIDDGTAQRGVVRSITLHFDGPVDSAPPSAFPITDQSNNPIAGLTVGVAGVGTNALTLTFSDGSAVNVGPVTYGSLADGRYRLKVDGSLLASGGVAVDADGNGSAGGVSTTDFIRLFGDFNGDAFVDATDLYPFLVNSIDKGAGDEGFKHAFDYDGNGFVDATDIYPEIVARIDAGL